MKGKKPRQTRVGAFYDMADQTGATDLPIPIPRSRVPEPVFKTVAIFQRLMREVGPPVRGAMLRHPGWIPYVLGFGPEPPEGQGDTHPTAWSLPG